MLGLIDDWPTGIHDQIIPPHCASCLVAMLVHSCHETWPFIPFRIISQSGLLLKKERSAKQLLHHDKQAPTRRSQWGIVTRVLPVLATLICLLISQLSYLK
jgi:hypothetical protein